VLRPRPTLQKPLRSEVPGGCDRARIQVKFLDDLDVGLDDTGVPFDRAGRVLARGSAPAVLGGVALAGGVWRRNTGADEATLDRLRARAQASLGREIADLNNFFLLDVPPGRDAASWMDALNLLPEVELAFPVALAAEPPSGPACWPSSVERAPALLPGDLTDRQGYLLPATGGIDAEFLRTLAGGAGANVVLVDCEYSFNAQHLDLPAVTLVVPAGLVHVPLFQDHGTAVLGIQSAIDNGFGTIGAATGVRLRFAPEYFESPLFSQRNIALQNAVAGLSAGDVVLLEQQMGGPAGNYVPVEWDLALYTTIVTAVGNGIHVVEAAGNGSQNLDALIYRNGNGNHWPFLPENDSGAIMVGAGGAPAAFGGTTADRSRMSFSNYGSTVDVQGWGTLVTTTGYGDAYRAEGANLYYTTQFGGTSSASAIVASAVVLLESFHEARFGTVLSPAAMRSLLVATGSPQQPGTYPVSQHIGPRPDLRAAVCMLDTAGPTLTCPADIGVDATEEAGTPASDPAIAAFLAGFSASDDIDPDPQVATDAPTFFPLGPTTVTSTATDACGNRTTCERTVNVVDRTAPVLTIALSRTTLLPANQRLAAIKVVVTVADACDPNPTIELESIQSDEPDAGTEKGDLPGDIQDAAPGTHDLVFSLRAERMSHGSGRTYTITYSVSDSCGNRSEASATVVVP
jgi:subtilisin family serine protease